MHVPRIEVVTSEPRHQWALRTVALVFLVAGPVALTSASPIARSDSLDGDPFTGFAASDLSIGTLTVTRGTPPAGPATAIVLISAPPPTWSGGLSDITGSGALVPGPSFLPDWIKPAD